MPSLTGLVVCWVGGRGQAERLDPNRGNPVKRFVKKSSARSRTVRDRCRTVVHDG